MIPDIGWMELLIIGALAIIVVGPKDLPRLMRTLGRWMGQAQKMASEFRKSFEELARESELEDLRQQVEDLKKIDPLEDIKQSIDPRAELRDVDRDVRRSLEGDSKSRGTPDAGPAIGDVDAVNEACEVQMKPLEASDTESKNDDDQDEAPIHGVKP